MHIPGSILAATVGCDEPELLGCTEQSLAGGAGAATESVTRLSGTAWCGNEERRFSLVRKAFVRAEEDARHWAYWQREPLAYRAGILPTGPGLRAPRCYGVVDDVVYLEDVIGDVEDPRVAAARLGGWQSSAGVPDVAWLADDELARRMAARPLDWSSVAADPRWASIWARRDELLAERARGRIALTHGDFHLGNLVATGTATVVLDWGNLGRAPIGTDLAHLSLSTRADLVADYLAGAAGEIDEAELRRGHRATVLLVGAGRAHWWHSRDIDVPAGYVDFVTEYAD